MTRAPTAPDLAAPAVGPVGMVDLAVPVARVPRLHPRKDKTEPMQSTARLPIPS